MKQRHLLVLDDEPWQLSWIKPMAKAYGWEVHFAEKYVDAEKLFDQYSPQIVIVDVRIGDDAPPRQGATLEGVDESWIGLRFVRHIRVERKSKVRIFVYSGVDRVELQQTVENAYSSTFCSKFDSATFEARLEAEMTKK